MFYNFVDNEQFNFQINRAVTYGEKYLNLKEVFEIAPRLTGFESWTKEWLALADKAMSEKRYSNAIYYYRMAEFYMMDKSDEKKKCYDNFINAFRKHHEKENLEYFKIPFEDTYMPAYKLKAENEKGILLIHGGYDSFIEEFFPILETLPKKGYTVITFEGPGQGLARKNNLTFRYDWEVPTSVVLDYFDLNNVSIMGISWGGYLAPRAAAFDKRIKNIICYDIFYSGLDMISNRLPKEVFAKLNFLLDSNQKLIINTILRHKMKNNIDLTWKIKHGMYITGTETPYDFLKSIQQHDMSKIVDKITQNILLLAGENDQYVPIARLEQLNHELINAKSITMRRFTKEESADQHCQVGNTEVVLNEVADFLEKHSLS